MRELSVAVKGKVIKLFLEGFAYDEIVRKLGISKGSVVAIIGEFREGRLQLPESMTGFVDALRRLVIDMKKHGITLGQLLSLMTIHAKLRDMDADPEEVGSVLNISRELAASADSNGEFVSTVVDLARLAEETGLNCLELAEDYQAKASESKDLTTWIQQLRGESAVVQSSLAEEREKAKRERASFSEAANAVEKACRQRREAAQIQLDEFMELNRLSWEKVNLACALFEDGLKKSGVGEPEMRKISSDIVAIGSLHAYAKQAQTDKARLDGQLSALANDLKNSQAELQDMKEWVVTVEERRNKLASEVAAGKQKQREVDRVISEYVQEINVVRVITLFLTMPNHLMKDDYWDLASLMRRLGQLRTGIRRDTEEFRDRLERGIPLPRLERRYEMYFEALNTARAKLANWLVPLTCDGPIRYELPVSENHRAAMKSMRRLQN